VVVNPTHVAVALEYSPPDVLVPIVLVRASDEGALRVREEAKTHGIPIVENIPLARALFAAANVGDAIPHEHYVAVAEIVAALTREGVLQ
jgi:flagellar biosynthetic protein FlhB